MKRLKPETIKKMQDLKRQGKTYDEIKQETGVSVATIAKYAKGIEEGETTVASNVVEQSLPFGESPHPLENVGEDYDVEFLGPQNRPQEALIEIDGVPVNRKISLSPKNLLMWDCFRKTYPQWNGDLSNFINESMDCTFKALKMNMKITIGELIQ